MSTDKRVEEESSLDKVAIPLPEPEKQEVWTCDREVNSNTKCPIQCNYCKSFYKAEENPNQEKQEESEDEIRNWIKSNYQGYLPGDFTVNEVVHLLQDYRKQNNS